MSPGPLLVERPVHTYTAYTPYTTSQTVTPFLAPNLPAYHGGMDSPPSMHSGGLWIGSDLRSAVTGSQWRLAARDRLDGRSRNRDRGPRDLGHGRREPGAAGGGVAGAERNFLHQLPAEGGCGGRQCIARASIIFRWLTTVSHGQLFHTPRKRPLRAFFLLDDRHL
jgi:hypothetical protein